MACEAFNHTIRIGEEHLRLASRVASWPGEIIASINFVTLPLIIWKWRWLNYNLLAPSCVIRPDNDFDSISIYLSAIISSACSAAILRLCITAYAAIHRNITSYMRRERLMLRLTAAGVSFYAFTIAGDIPIWDKYCRRLFIARRRLKKR